MVKSLITIRKSRPAEIQEISKILAPAFEDKVTAVIGDADKALRIIPIIIRSIVGAVFVAEDIIYVDSGGGGGRGGRGKTERKESAILKGEEEDVHLQEISGESPNSVVHHAHASSSGRLVGAIIISTTEFKITLPIIMICLKVLGVRGSWNAFRMVKDYLKSEPKKLEREGRLEAVGVLEDQRGLGIGKELVMKGENYLLEQGMKFFGLGVKTDNPAYHLYLNLGFGEVERYNNSLDDWIYMRKRLKQEYDSS